MFPDVISAKLIPLLPVMERPRQTGQAKSTQSDESLGEESHSDIEKRPMKYKAESAVLEIQRNASPVYAPEMHETCDTKAKARGGGSTDEENYSSEGEEPGQLVFDTKNGKLVRPIPAGAHTDIQPKIEEGKSEEEDGYQASITNEKIPSKPRGSLDADKL